MAPAPGVALMGVWQWIARALGGEANDQAAIKEAERILLEADFGVEATLQLIEGMRGAPSAERQGYLERATAELLVGPADAGLLACAATPPTVILLYGVNGVGKPTIVVAAYARRLVSG